MNNDSQPHQPKLHYDDVDDALKDLILALGGNKKVGHRLWPAKTMEDASQLLRHSLDKSRREKLDQYELMTLLRWGREIGFHGAKHFIDDGTGYNRSSPSDPKEEKDKAVEAVRAAAEALTRATVALERAQIAGAQLVVVS